MTTSDARTQRAVLVAAVLLASCARAHAAGQDTLNEAQQLRMENARLQKLATLASGKDFYLLLEPRRKAMKLMFEGVVLKEVPVLEITLGQREVFFVDWKLPEGWQDEIWEGGLLDPPRRLQRKEIIPPNGAAGPPAPDEVVIPPTPEEAVPAPDRYRVRFKGGRSLEILAAGADSRGGFWERSVGALGHRMEEVAEALLPSRSDAIRLRVVLEPEQARMLYRSLPENSSFLLVGGV